MNRPEPHSEIAHLRVPPHSVEAEQAILGGLLLDNAAWDRVGDLLTDGDFYRMEHRLIYAAVGALLSAGKPADMITVFEHLQVAGKADDVGLAYLNGLVQSLPSAANIRKYAEIVRERSIRRMLIAMSDEIATAAFGERSALDVLAMAQERVFRMGDEGSRGTTGPQDLQDLAVRVLEEAQDAAERGAPDVAGLSTGFTDLDRKLSGMQGGQLIVLAARPSMGKTAFAMNIAEHVAVAAGLPVLVFSMEMDSIQLARRILASNGRLRSHALRTGQLHDAEWARLSDAVERLRSATVFIDETAALSMAEVQLRSRRQARICGKLGLVVVDYLQLMSGAGSEENRATAIGEISRGLKALAKELQCPVIALSQLNRSVESRTDKRPMMSDLRESGAIEQDSDVILFIYRDDYYNADTENPGVAEIIIGKQRDGPTGTVELAWLAPLTKFDNLSQDYKDAVRQKRAEARQAKEAKKLR